MEHNAIPSSESLDELDTLLEESLAVAQAKKLQKQGRKLSLEQQAILDANKLAVEMDRWVSHEVYAHVAHVYCSCGAFHEQFRGWYKYQELRHGNGRRLIKSDDHDDLPAYRYTTEEEVNWCADCMGNDLPEADVDLNDLLVTLGTPAAGESAPASEDEPRETFEEPAVSEAHSEHTHEVTDGGEYEE